MLYKDLIIDNKGITNKGTEMSWQCIKSIRKETPHPTISFQLAPQRVA
jgi:hypothetical protein